MLYSAMWLALGVWCVLVASGTRTRRDTSLHLSGRFTQTHSALDVELNVPRDCLSVRSTTPGSADQTPSTEDVRVSSIGIGFPACGRVFEFAEDVVGIESSVATSKVIRKEKATKTGSSTSTTVAIRLRLQKTHPHYWTQVFAPAEKVEMRQHSTEDEDDRADFPVSRHVKLLKKNKESRTTFDERSSLQTRYDGFRDGGEDHETSLSKFFKEEEGLSHGISCAPYLADHGIQNFTRVAVVAPRFPWCTKCLHKDKALRTVAKQVAKAAVAAGAAASAANAHEDDTDADLSRSATDIGMNDNGIVFATLNAESHRRFTRRYNLQCDEECRVFMCRTDEPEMYATSIYHSYRMTDMDLMMGAMGGGEGGVAKAPGDDKLEPDLGKFENELQMLAVRDLFEVVHVGGAEEDGSTTTGEQLDAFLDASAREKQSVLVVLKVSHEDNHPNLQQELRHSADFDRHSFISRNVAQGGVDRVISGFLSEARTFRKDTKTTFMVAFGDRAEVEKPELTVWNGLEQGRSDKYVYNASMATLSVGEFLQQTTQPLLRPYSFAMKKDKEVDFFAIFYANSTDAKVDDVQQQAVEHARDVVMSIAVERRRKQAGEGVDAGTKNATEKNLAFLQLDTTWSYFLKDFGYNRHQAYPSPAFGLRSALEVGKGQNFVLPGDCARWIRREIKVNTTAASTSTSAASTTLPKTAATDEDHAVAAPFAEENAAAHEKRQRNLQRFKKCFSHRKLRRFLESALAGRIDQSRQSGAENATDSVFTKTPVGDLTWKSLQAELAGGGEGAASSVSLSGRAADSHIVVELYHRDQDRRFERESILHTVGVVFAEVPGLKFFRYEVSENYAAPEVFASAKGKDAADQVGNVFLFRARAQPGGRNNDRETAGHRLRAAPLQRGPPAVFKPGRSKTGRALVDSLIKWVHKTLEEVKGADQLQHSADPHFGRSARPSESSSMRKSVNLREALDMAKDLEPEILDRARVADDNEQKAKREKQQAIDKMMKTLKQEKGLYDVRDAINGGMGMQEGTGTAAEKDPESREDKADVGRTTSTASSSPPLQQFRGGKKGKSTTKKEGNSKTQTLANTKSGNKDSATTKPAPTYEGVNGPAKGVKKPKSKRKTPDVQGTPQKRTKRQRELEERAAAADRRADEELEIAEATSNKNENSTKKTTTEKEKLSRTTSRSLAPAPRTTTPENLIYSVSWAQTRDTLHMTLHFSSSLKECLTTASAGSVSFFDAVQVEVLDDTVKIYVQDVDLETLCDSTPAHGFRNVTLPLREYIDVATPSSLQIQKGAEFSQVSGQIEPTAHISVKKVVAHRWDKLLSGKNLEGVSLRKDWPREDPTLEDEEEIELPSCKGLKRMSGQQLETIFSDAEAHDAAKVEESDTRPRLLSVLFRFPWCKACEQKDKEFVNFIKWKRKELPQKVNAQFAVVDAREHKEVARRFGVSGGSAASKDGAGSELCDPTCPIHVFKREEGLDRYYTVPAKRWHEEYLLEFYQFAVPLVNVLKDEDACGRWSAAFHTSVVMFVSSDVVNMGRNEKTEENTTTDNLYGLSDAKVWQDFLQTARELRGNALFGATNLDYAAVSRNRTEDAPVIEFGESRAVGRAGGHAFGDVAAGSHAEPIVIVFKPQEKRAVRFPGPMTADALTEFSKTLSVPLVSSFDFHARQKLAELGMPVGLLWVDDDPHKNTKTGEGAGNMETSGAEDVAKPIEIIEGLAKKYAGKMAFAKLSVGSEGIFMRDFGLNPARLPAFGIIERVDSSVGGSAATKKQKGGHIASAPARSASSEIARERQAASEDEAAPRYAFAGLATDEVALADFVGAFFAKKLPQAFRTNELSKDYVWEHGRGQVQETVWSRFWLDVAWLPRSNLLEDKNDQRGSSDGASTVSSSGPSSTNTTRAADNDWKNQDEKRSTRFVLLELYSPNRAQHSTHLLLVNLLALGLKGFAELKIVRMDKENNHTPDGFLHGQHSVSSQKSDDSLSRTVGVSPFATMSAAGTSSSTGGGASTEYFFLDAKRGSSSRFRVQVAKLLDLPTRLLSFVQTRVQDAARKDRAEKTDAAEQAEIADPDVDAASSPSAAQHNGAEDEAQATCAISSEDQDVTNTNTNCQADTSFFDYATARAFVKEQVQERVRKMKRMERERERKHHESWAQYEIEEFLRYERKGFKLDQLGATSGLFGGGGAAGPSGVGSPPTRASRML